MQETNNILEKIQEITGREYKTEEEALKHLKNIQGLAFSKKEDLKKELQNEFDSAMEEERGKVKEETEKKYTKYEEFILEAGIDLEKVNPLAIKEYLGEQHAEIAPRAAVQESTNNKVELENRARTGDEEAIQELVANQFSNKK